MFGLQAPQCGGMPCWPLWDPQRFLCCSAGESNVVIRKVLYSGQAFAGLENVLDLRPTLPSGGTIDRCELMRGDQKE